MRDIFSKRVFGAELDPADGVVVAKRLAVLVVVLFVLGAATIFLVQRHIAAMDTWKATVTGVSGRGRIVNFTFEEGSDDIDVASYPAGMALETGDRVVIKIDQTRGNLVVRALGR